VPRLAPGLERREQLAEAGDADAVLALIAAIACSDPRAYEGPREARSVQPEIDPFEAAVPTQRDAALPDITSARRAE